MEKPAYFTNVHSHDVDSRTVVVTFGDPSSIRRSGYVTVRLTHTDVPEEFDAVVAELEVLKTIVADPWRLISDYHHHANPGVVGIAWAKRALNTIQVSQGATRKCLLAAIRRKCNHPAARYAQWAVYWLPGAKLKVCKTLADDLRSWLHPLPEMVKEVEDYVTPSYELEARYSLENVVKTPWLGDVELSLHAIDQFAYRSGLVPDANGEYAEHSAPNLISAPRSLALALSKQLQRTDIHRLHLADPILKRKQISHVTKAEYWGIPETRLRLTIVPQLGGRPPRLVTVYNRRHMVGSDPGEQLATVTLPIREERHTSARPWPYRTQPSTHRSLDLA